MLPYSDGRSSQNIWRLTRLFSSNWNISESFSKSVMTLEGENTSATFASIAVHPILNWTLVHLNNYYNLQYLYQSLRTRLLWQQTFANFQIFAKHSPMKIVFSKYWGKQVGTKYPKFSAMRFIREKGEVTTLLLASKPSASSETSDMLGYKFYTGWIVLDVFFLLNQMPQKQILNL